MASVISSIFYLFLMFVLIFFMCDSLAVLACILYVLFDVYIACFPIVYGWGVKRVGSIYKNSQGVIMMTPCEFL